MRMVPVLPRANDPGVLVESESSLGFHGQLRRFENDLGTHLHAH